MTYLQFAIVDADRVDSELERMQKAAREHPPTPHTAAGGWCIHCGCGNDVLGYQHLTNCTRPQIP